MIINIAGGTGIMGKLHAPVFEEQGHTVILSGRKTTPGLEEAAKNSDLTIVSVPLSVTENVIKQVAPYCSAIMDFSSAKIKPIKWMLKYSNKECEVGGLHPLYGDVNSIKDQTIVYCPTKKSGDRCSEIISILEAHGANIKTKNPKDHDEQILTFQNERIVRNLNLGLSYIEREIDIDEAYNLAPPPQRIELDLLARQITPTNDEMYVAMAEFGKKPLDRRLKEASKKIRTWFGDYLEIAQERTKEIITNNYY